MRSAGLKSRRPTAPATLSARLRRHVTLEADSAGRLVAGSGGFSLDLGRFGADVIKRAQRLRAGLPVASFASGRRKDGKEIDVLVRRLARHGLLEYRLHGSRIGEDAVVIEPQLPDYWPRTVQLREGDALVLSRFAYIRRRGDETVLESPRAGALFKICDAAMVATIATLARPRKVKELRFGKAFPGRELLALLVDCQILFKFDAARGNVRAAEGDDDLALWDFHDLLFHARSTEGRHANPIGGVYPHAGAISPLPAVRPRWPGRKIDLRKASAAHPENVGPVAKLLRERHSTRRFDDEQPMNLAELSRLLDGAVRVLSKWKSEAHVDGAGPVVEYALRPYPSAGASYELELYLAVDKCGGLDRGFYHYDADGHALVPIEARAHDLEAMLTGARLAMGESAAPQVLITIAARFGRMSWKYSSIAYALILKDVGVLTQTLYLLATDMGLGGCAIGSVNIDLFTRMTGIEFHVEGPVGQFAIGRGAR